MMRLALRAAVPIISCLAALASGGTPDETAAWRVDLRILRDDLPKHHVNAFHAVSREDWDRGVAELDAAIPTLDRDRFLVGLMKLVARIGEGHTTLSPFLDDAVGFHGVGARVYAFSDGLYVWAAEKNRRDLVGAKLVGVGGVDVTEAWRRIAETVAHDNDEGLRELVPVYLGVPEILHGVGLGSGESAAWTLEKEGRRFDVVLPAGAPLRGPRLGHAGAYLWVLPSDWLDARELSNAAAPAWLEAPEDMYRMKDLPGRRTLYVQYNTVANKPEESIAAFFDRVFRFAAEHATDRLVLDVRNNSGGNNFLNAPIVRGILRAHLDEKGRLFVVIGRSTFSAAQNIVNDLARFAEPVFVGEPTGSRPSQYGDPEPLLLPKTGVRVMVSTTYWPDRPGHDNRPWTAPQLPALLSFSDYREGRDPVLSAIEKYRSIEAALAPAIASGDSAGVEAAARAFASDPATAAISTESEMNALGYRLLSEGKTAMARTIFQLNAERYPRSANAHDSLGEAFLAERKLDLARAEYRRVLELSPGNENAARMLREVDRRAAGEGTQR